MPEPCKSESLLGVVRQVDILLDDKTVVIELICSAKLDAQVVYEDMRSRFESEDGLLMTLRLRSVEVTKAGD
jgi:hypothetical protein